MIDDIEALVASSSARDVLGRLAALDEKQRRALSKPVLALFKQWYSAAFSAVKKGPALRDEDALKVAMLATATPSELRPYRFMVVPRSPTLVDTIRALEPSWVDGWVEGMIEDSPGFASNAAPLWRAALCRRPTGDALILGYYTLWGGRTLADDPEFLTEDAWRFFEVEGGGELSLAAYDKYCGGKSESWSSYLLTLSKEGKLDRDRLLDVSLEALERDFGQFRAGWYSRFHTALEPSPAEQAARCDRYLHLLSSAVPPTVSLALKTLKALDKVGEVPVDELLAAIGPALISRQKSAALDALALLASAAKRAPERADEIAVIALSALVSEAADVQEKALDLVDRLGRAGSPAVQSALAEYRDLVAPSTRRRLAAMLEAPIDDAPAEAREDAPAAAEIAAFAPITPYASLEETLAGYLAALEDPRDPLAVERAMDGLSRFGAAAPPDSVQLSPLAKRARALFEKIRDQRIRRVLAACGRAWCGDGLPSELLPNGGAFGGCIEGTFVARCDEIVARVKKSEALPLLSLPTNASGEVAPGDLVDRVEQYRAAGATPGTADLALALTRLGREGRNLHRDRVDPSDEIGRVIAFALGAGDAAAGDGPLWAAAWLARSENGQQALWPSKAPEPDAGVAAQYQLIVEKDGTPPHEWCHPFVAVTPALQKPDPLMPATLLHHRHKHMWMSSTACGYEPADIAWSSLVRPGDPEAFLANAIGALDTCQKLADHPSIAYLDAFDRLRGGPGPIGYAVLAFHLASEDKALCAHTVDKIFRLIEEQRLSADRFAAAILPFMLIGPFPSMRWTRALAELAGAGPGHRAFVREVVTGLMRFDPALAPRDIGGMIELLYELQVDSGAPFDDAAALACLAGLEGGGKTAKFAKKLLSLKDG